MSAIPEIETDRLTLRGHRIEDWQDCVAMWAEPEVTRYIGGAPSTPEATWSRILRYAGHWAMLGFGYWAIHHKATGRFVGEAGLADFKRDIEPSFDGAPEIGWALATWAHGKGYGTEAVRAVLSWADANIESRRTVCIIAPENVPSIRVAGKCGYSPIGTAQYKGQSSGLYERLR